MAMFGFEVEAWSDSCVYTYQISRFTLSMLPLCNVVYFFEVPNSMYLTVLSREQHAA